MTRLLPIPIGYTASLVPRPPRPAFVACSMKSGGRPGQTYHMMRATAELATIDPVAIRLAGQTEQKGTSNSCDSRWFSCKTAAFFTEQCTSPLLFFQV